MRSWIVSKTYRASSSCGFLYFQEDIAVAGVTARYTKDTLKRTKSKILIYQRYQLARSGGIAFTAACVCTLLCRGGILNWRWSACFALCGTLPFVSYLFFPSREIRDLLTDLEKKERQSAELNQKLVESIEQFDAMKVNQRAALDRHEHWYIGLGI